MSVEELELLRKKARNKVIVGIIITIIITFIIGIISNLFSFNLIFVFLIGMIITLFASKKSKNEFINAYKKTFVLESLKTVFTDLIYKPDSGLDESIIRYTQMMNMGDRYSSNDYISGKYKNIKIEQADVHIQEERTTTDSEGHTHTTWVTIFMGRWMIFDFNKMFKANLQVCQKGFSNSKVNNWGEKEKYQKVNMEDVEFNKMFSIYAQSEHEAFYILTPALMEKIKKLTHSINGRILLCFIDNKLHVGIQNNQDSFEHSIFTKINKEKEMEEISKDIKLITDFINELDLDNNLFIRKEV